MMIKNDRQLGLTKSSLTKMNKALANVSQNDTALPKELVKAQFDALQSEIEILENDIREYKELKNGSVTHFQVTSLAELPITLICARIARGYTHLQLAEMLGLKQQQIQRWEKEEYQTATLESLRSVADALEIETSHDVFITSKSFNWDSFIRRVQTVGLTKELITKRILPPSLRPNGNDSDTTLLKAASYISNIIGVQVGSLFDDRPIFPLAMAGVRYKKIKNADEAKVDGYTLYAHYVSGILVRALNLPQRSDRPDQSWKNAAEQLREYNEEVSLQSVLEYAWDLGIAVLPLEGSGGFHGAVWAVDNKYVAVLKQTNGSESKWIFDLLHELGHIALEHVGVGEAIVEDAEISLSSEQESEEIDASEWAEDVLFNGLSEEVEEKCVSKCGGKIPRLKGIVPTIASEIKVPTGVLANHMAWRLADQGEDWWGTAQTLQRDEKLGLDIALKFLYKKLSLGNLSPIDREMLERALM